MLQTVGMQPGLKGILVQRAKTYTPDPSEQRHLVERTISSACDDLDLLEGRPLKNALFCVIHNLVRAPIRQAPEDRGQAPWVRVAQRS